MKLEKNQLKNHARNSTIVALLAALASAGFVAFARITAEINPAFQPLQYSSVFIATLVSGYAAYALFELLKEYTNRPYEIFMYVSGIVLILSYMPIGHTAVGMETAGKAEINVLATIHALAAAFIVSGIAKIEMMRSKDS